VVHPEVIVTYNKYRRYGRKRSYAEDNRGQGVLRDRIFWCECKGKKEESGAPTERKSAAKIEKAARGQENQKA